MKYVLTIVFGLLSGLIGGMGMGGGTLLIPMLSFLDIEQHTIQAINLLAFLPMSIAALKIHKKNNLLKPRGTFHIIAWAVPSSIIGALLTNITQPEVLRMCFGVFMLLFGVCEIISALSKILNRNKAKQYRNSFDNETE